MSFDTLMQRTIAPSNYTRLEGYYNGEVTLDALGVSLPPDVRVLELTATFPKLSVDVLTETMIPSGFVLGADQELPDLLRRWWAANNLDTTTSLAITEALVQGAAYWIIGGGTDDTPMITAHGRRGVATRLDDFGRVVEAVRTWSNEDEESAAHYVPGQTTYYSRSPLSGQWVQKGEAVRTGLDRVPIVPMFNKERLHDTRGRSDMLQIISTTDAASRTLTNLQVIQEMLHSLRYFLSDDVGQNILDGAKKKGISQDTAMFRMSIGSMLVGNSEDKIGQLPGADPRPLIDIYRHYATIVSAITGIPPSMLGISTDNPSSAEAMRASKERLIAKAERKSSVFGDAIEEVFRLALEMYGQLPPDGAPGLELQWRDPATASESARSAALLQAHAQGVISAETAREGLRLTPEQMARERELSRELMVSVNQLGA